ncbi:MULTISPECIES: hypothetical protein [Actinosynnema]|uniref:hypothetical protein n=1 Tax=Actinosynnema TaxID=40566 RepID=UPI0020A45D66|nr:hypothetical protein [Actinosynnema pretiosum]MCP2094615.1 hypothetical protein [Actinosynnema pretiosum]
MADEAHANSVTGDVGMAAQVGNVHGGLHLHGPGPGRWMTPAAIGVVAVSVVVAAVIVATGRDGGTAAPGEPRPFLVEVEREDPVGTPKVSDLVFPAGAVTGLPAPPARCAAWHPFAREHGADRHAGVSAASVTLIAGDRPLRVHGLTPVIERLDSAPAGEAIRCEGGTGGAITTSWLDLDLDSGTYEYRYPVEGAKRTDFPEGAGLPGIPFALVIPPDGAERVEVSARSADCFCRWSLELDLEVDGRHYPTVVDAGGKPFETLPGRGFTTEYRYDEATGTWARR